MYLAHIIIVAIWYLGLQLMLLTFTRLLIFSLSNTEYPIYSSAFHEIRKCPNNHTLYSNYCDLLFQNI